MNVLFISNKAYVCTFSYERMFINIYCGLYNNNILSLLKQSNSAAMSLFLWKFIIAGYNPLLFLICISFIFISSLWRLKTYQIYVFDLYDELLYAATCRISAIIHHIKTGSPIYRFVELRVEERKTILHPKMNNVEKSYAHLQLMYFLCRLKEKGWTTLMEKWSVKRNSYLTFIVKSSVTQRATVVIF